MSMTSYEIEKFIPIKKYSESCKNYPFDKMEIMDSFLIPVKRLKDDTDEEYRIKVGNAQRLVFSAGRSYARRNKDFKLITRRTDKGVRVWRKS